MPPDIDTALRHREKHGVHATPEAQADPPVGAPCANCGTPRLGRFCQACGEKRLEPAHDHSLRWIAEQVLEGLINLDTKLLRTFGTLLLRPGRLTRDHLDGRRVRYMQPLQVFFVTSVLFYCFFANAYAAPVTSLANGYDRGFGLGNLLHFDIDAAITAKAAASGQGEAVLRLRIADRAGHESKLFLGVLMPFLALLLQLLFRRQATRFVPHAIAAVHLFAVFLLFDLLFLFGWRIAGANSVSDWMFLPLILAFVVHVSLAVRRIYGVGRVVATLKTLVLVTGFALLIVAYRQLVTIAAVLLV